jgi:hypothetical protein
MKDSLNGDAPSTPFASPECAARIENDKAEAMGIKKRKLSNSDIADRLASLAQLLSVQDSYKVEAYRRAHPTGFAIHSMRP